MTIQISLGSTAADLKRGW